LFFLSFVSEIRAAETDVPGRWPAGKAWTWYKTRPWPVGCNYVPATAVNDVEMWQKSTFDPATMERELTLARGLGFNNLRVFLNFVVWQDDPAGLKERLGRFLEIADRHGLSVMPVLLDDCNFAGREARVGKQADPVPGVHNSGWVSSPPLRMVTDQKAWPMLERYVKDMVDTFREDRRIILWDLYNEPGNSATGAGSLPLMEAAFRWARAVKPCQPLTVGAWADFRDAMHKRMFGLSDVISFHGYDARPGIEAKIALCQDYRRPILCTEWLRRQAGNTFQELLPLFRQQRIGCWSWGLVAGRTQTYFSWGSRPGSPEPRVWQHDLFRPNGQPFDAGEVDFIRKSLQVRKVG
jgi:hypothetical protein